MNSALYFIIIIHYYVRVTHINGAGGPFLTLSTIFYLIFFCICLLQTTYKPIHHILWGLYFKEKKVNIWKLTYRCSKLVWSSNFHNISCIYTLANSYQIWKMTSYQNLLIAYRFIFFKNTSFIYNWPPDTPIQCSPRLISVCEQF